MDLSPPLDGTLGGLRCDELSLPGTIKPWSQSQILLDPGRCMTMPGVSENRGARDLWQSLHQPKAFRVNDLQTCQLASLRVPTGNRW